MWLKINDETLLNLDLIKNINFYGDHSINSTSGNYRINIDGKDFYISRVEEAQIKQFFLSLSYYPVTTVGNVSQDIHIKMDSIFSILTGKIHKEIINQKLAVEAESKKTEITPTPVPSGGSVRNNLVFDISDVAQILGSISNLFRR